MRRDMMTRIAVALACSSIASTLVVPTALAKNDRADDSQAIATAADRPVFSTKDAVQKDAGEAQQQNASSEDLLRYAAYLVSASAMYVAAHEVQNAEFTVANRPESSYSAASPNLSQGLFLMQMANVVLNDYALEVFKQNRQ